LTVVELRAVADGDIVDVEDRTSVSLATKPYVLAGT
jgi:hypothetical protein